MSGSLVVVGTGIGAGQLTADARAAIAEAEEVFFLVGDPLSEHALLELAPRARSLAGCYDDGGPGPEAYERMVQLVLEPALAGRHVCAAFYGHPGVFVSPSREAIARARAAGIDARMLPGISSLDCLFADLGVDPAAAGCQVYEAGDFTRRRPAIDPESALVLLQIGVVSSRAELEAVLRRSYPGSHALTVYEASPYPGIAPQVDGVLLGDLGAAVLSQRSTMYVPPLARR